jgi:hypothetical protein
MLTEAECKNAICPPEKKQDGERRMSPSADAYQVVLTHSDQSRKPRLALRPWGILPTWQARHCGKTIPIRLTDP